MGFYNQVQCRWHLGKIQTLTSGKRVYPNLWCGLLRDFCIGCQIEYGTSTPINCSKFRLDTPTIRHEEHIPKQRFGRRGVHGHSSRI